MHQKNYAEHFNKMIEAWTTADSEQINMEVQRINHQIEILKAQNAALQHVLRYKR